MEIKFRKDLNLLLDEFKLPRIVCEAGVAEGRLSRQICEWGIDKLYLIDNWRTIQGQKGDGSFDQSWHDNNFMEAMERTAPWQHKVTVFRGLTKDMLPLIPNNSLGLIYIDAAHDYKSVLEDLMLSYDKIVSGGIISGHDFLNLSPNYGVNKAVYDFVPGRATQLNLIPEDEPNNASFWFQKP
jgi:hypothetical protein